MAIFRRVIFQKILFLRKFLSNYLSTSIIVSYSQIQLINSLSFKNFSGLFLSNILCLESSTSYINISFLNPKILFTNFYLFVSSEIMNSLSISFSLFYLIRLYCKYGLILLFSSLKSSQPIFLINLLFDLNVFNK